MELIEFKSEPKQTPFAPEWHWLIFQDEITDVDFNSLAEFILSKEKEILDKYPLTNKLNIDGYTNLGPDSLTSRYGNYNLLNLDHPELPKLLLAIKRTHFRVLQFLNLPNRKLRIQCWANVLRTGQKIAPHLHDCTPYAYLSGHVNIQCNKENNETYTVYINPINQIQDPVERKLKNKQGTITLFQANIPHYTTEHIGDRERITVAFDIVPDETVPLSETDRIILFDEP